ncbi:hypothetical protein OROMI_028824 [Orobanche minor]
MEPKISLLDAITPETKNWTAKVYVLNKTEPRTSSQPTSIRFQKLLLTDNKENKVEGMMYRGDIELLKNSLRLHQTYLISKAVVRPVKPGFRNPLTNNKYQWILGARTAILAIDKDALISSELAHTSTHSDQFHDFLGTKTLISTAAIIIDSHAPRTVTAKGKQNTLHEYAAVDELYFIYKERIDVLQQQGDVFKQAQTNFSSDPKTFTSIQILLTIEQPNRYDLLVRGKLARANQNFIYP